MPTSEVGVAFLRELSDASTTKTQTETAVYVPQSCRVFARIKRKRVISNTVGGSDFVNGIAVVMQHPILMGSRIFFDSYAFTGQNMNVGPAALPPTDPLDVQEGDILYGVAVYQKQRSNYVFRWCTWGRQVHLLKQLVTTDCDNVRRHRKELAITNGVYDESLYVMGRLLTGDMSTVLDLAKPETQQPADAPIIRHAVDKFVKAVALFCRNANLFRYFCTLMELHKDTVRPAVYKACNNHTVRHQFTQEIVDAYCRNQQRAFELTVAAGDSSVAGDNEDDDNDGCESDFSC